MYYYRVSVLDCDETKKYSFLSEDFHDETAIIYKHLNIDSVEQLLAFFSSYEDISVKRLHGIEHYSFEFFAKDSNIVTHILFERIEAHETSRNDDKGNMIYCYDVCADSTEDIPSDTPIF